MPHSAAYARFQPDDRPEPAQLIDFTVEVENFDVTSGTCELTFRSFYRLHCRWARDVIDVVTIEAKVWRGSCSIWLVVDPSDHAAQILLEHFASPAGQKHLALECGRQEEEAEHDE